MNNQIIDEFDKASLIKEIHERDIIICNYQKCGFLDRNSNGCKSFRIFDSFQSVNKRSNC